MSLLHMNHKRDLKNCEFNCLVSQIRNKRAINIARATGEKTEELNFALRSAATLNIYVQHIQQWTYFAIAIESSFPCPQLRDIQDIRERESGQHANVRSVHLSLKEFTRVHVATRGNVKWRLVNGARDGKLKEISSQQTSSRRRRNIKVNGRNLFRLKLCCEFFFFFCFHVSSRRCFYDILHVSDTLLPHSLDDFDRFTRSDRLFTRRTRKSVRETRNVSQQRRPLSISFWNSVINIKSLNLYQISTNEMLEWNLQGWIVVVKRSPHNRRMRFMIISVHLIKVENSLRNFVDDAKKQLEADNEVEDEVVGDEKCGLRLMMLMQVVQCFESHGWNVDWI